MVATLRTKRSVVLAPTGEEGADGRHFMVPRESMWAAVEWTDPDVEAVIPARDGMRFRRAVALALACGEDVTDLQPDNEESVSAAEDTFERMAEADLLSNSPALTSPAGSLGGGSASGGVPALSPVQRSALGEAEFAREYEARQAGSDASGRAAAGGPPEGAGEPPKFELPGEAAAAVEAAADADQVVLDRGIAESRRAAVAEAAERRAEAERLRLEMEEVRRQCAAEAVGLGRRPTQATGHRCGADMAVP